MDVINFFSAIIFLYEKFYLYLVAGLQSYGLAIIALSILTSIMMLRPIRWANKITKKEQEFQAVLLPQIRTIKKQSVGSLQHVRISALYQRYGYHPIFAIRRVAPLLIQLPFFLLAYFMLEGIAELDGKSFLFLTNLSLPDTILHRGNLLPFVMTAVNLAAALFIPNFSRKDLYQAIAISLLFFIILYHHASALLLYWTTNNVIILFRNIAAYNKADKNQRINFKTLWRRCIILIMRREALLFLIIFLVAILLSMLLFFTNNYNFSLTRAICIMLVFGVGFLIFIRFLFYTQAFGKDRYLYIKRIQLKLQYRTHKSRLSFPQVSFVDCTLVLIPLAPLIQYVMLNQYLMTFEQQLLFIGIGAAILFSIVIMIPYILEKFLPVYGLVPLSLTLSYVYLLMPEFSVIFRWASGPDLPLLAAILLILFSALFLLYLRQRKLLRFMAVIFFIISIMYTSYDIYTIQQAEEIVTDTQLFEPMSDFSNFIPTGPIKKNPDIYLLTYDAYVGQETMQQYGIDNSAQEEFLVNNGFKIYPGVYTVSTFSENSMSKVLGMVGGGHMYPFEVSNVATAGYALVVDILKSHGYKTYGLTPYPLIYSPAAWDYFSPQVDDVIGLKLLLKGIQIGQFDPNVIDFITDILDFDEADEEVTTSQLAVRRDIISAQTPYPKFMYSHSYYPDHSQFHGKCLPNETELFEQRLQQANREMKGDIDSILASKRDAIIIVNGDHGPVLTGDCFMLRGYSIADISQLDLQDRIGTFLAIRWPEQDYQQYDGDIRILQDTFESVFKFLYETDSVLRQRPNTETLGENGLAKGFVVDGKIMLGKDEGKTLFNN